MYEYSLSQNHVALRLSRHFRGILQAVLRAEWFTRLFKSLFTLRLLAPDGHHCTLDQNGNHEIQSNVYSNDTDSHQPQTLSGSSRSQNFHTGLYCC